MSRQNAKSVEQCFTMTEIFRRRSGKVFNQELQKVGEILTDFVSACLSDTTDGSDQLLVSALHIVRIGAIDLQPHIFNRVLRPKLKLILRDQHQR